MLRLNWGVHHQQPKRTVPLLLETHQSSVNPCGTAARHRNPAGATQLRRIERRYSAGGSSLISGKVITVSSGGTSRGAANRSLVAARRLRRFMTPPLPAGVSRPTITFSFRPLRRSTLSAKAAAVSTRGGSWEEAA